MITTPLLMPPPATALSTIKHRISVYRHYIASWARLNRQSLLLFAKLAIFLAKLVSITRPCLPVTARETILYPLITLAAIELSLGTRISWRFVGILAALHLAVVLWAVKLGGGLCVDRRLDGEWHWGDGVDE